VIDVPCDPLSENLEDALVDLQEAVFLLRDTSKLFDEYCRDPKKKTDGLTWFRLCGQIKSNDEFLREFIAAQMDNPCDFGARFPCCSAGGGAP
jgi:hypothetical protein